MLFRWFRKRVRGHDPCKLPSPFARCNTSSGSPRTQRSQTSLVLTCWTGGDQWGTCTSAILHLDIEALKHQPLVSPSSPGPGSSSASLEGSWADIFHSHCVVCPDNLLAHSPQTKRCKAKQVFPLQPQVVPPVPLDDLHAPPPVANRSSPTSVAPSANQTIITASPVAGYGQSFILQTEYALLTWLLNITEPEGQLARWMEN